MLLLIHAASGLLPGGGGIRPTCDHSPLCTKRLDNLRATEPSPIIEDWEAATTPRLPLNAIILEEPDELVWSDETLEFNGLDRDPRTPRALQAHLASFRLDDGVHAHAFDGSGEALSAFKWSASQRLCDRELALLILQLLDAVNFLHGRGSAHLGLDAEVIRLVRGERSQAAAKEEGSGEGGGAAGGADDPSGSKDCYLQLIGFGAAVRLQTSGQSSAGVERRSTYMLDSGVAFHAPELLSSAVLQSNLRSLLQIDSWAVGVLILMITGALNDSPYIAEVNWGAGLLTPEAATRSKIGNIQRDLGDFLLEIDGRSEGFLFRHGWVVRLLLGLLQQDPGKRLTVFQAWSSNPMQLGSNPRALTCPLPLLACSDFCPVLELLCGQLRATLC